MTDFLLWATDVGLNRIAQVHTFSQLTVKLRFNRPSTFLLEGIPDSSDAATALDADGAGLVVYRDGRLLSAGPVTRIDHHFAADRDDVEVAGADDDWWLWRRLAYPDPANEPDSWGEAQDVRTGAAETVMYGFVDANLGPSALTARRFTHGPALTLGNDQGRGTSLTGRGRGNQLGALLRTLAAADGFGFRIARDDRTRTFQVYETNDRTGSVVFKPDLGNVESYQRTTLAPDGNTAVVGGTGQDAARIFAEVADGDSQGRWGRLEVLHDARDAADATELAVAGDAFLSQTVSTDNVKVQPRDTAAVAFLDDYTVGDKVTVQVDGLTVQQVIREVHVVFNADGGEQVTPVVGPADVVQVDDNPFVTVFDRLDDIAGRVANLERTE